MLEDFVVIIRKGKGLLSATAGSFRYGWPFGKRCAVLEEAAEKRKQRLFVMAFVDEILVKKLPAFSQGKFTDEKLDKILQQVQ
jgi:hypothetical protein